MKLTRMAGSALANMFYMMMTLIAIAGRALARTPLHHAPAPYLGIASMSRTNRALDLGIFGRQTSTVGMLNPMRERHLEHRPTAAVTHWQQLIHRATGGFARAARSLLLGSPTSVGRLGLPFNTGRRVLHGRC